MIHKNTKQNGISEQYEYCKGEVFECALCHVALMRKNKVPVYNIIYTAADNTGGNIAYDETVCESVGDLQKQCV